jgi:hypothetical protein
LRTTAVGSGHRARLQPWVCFSPSAWTGSWTGLPDNPSVTNAVSARAQVIAAASAPGTPGRAPRKRQVSGSNPLTGSRSEGISTPYDDPRGTNLGRGGYSHITLRVAKVSHRATTERVAPRHRIRRDRSADGRAIRLKATARTEQARIEPGRLLKDASEGRTPETVATLLDDYALIASSAAPSSPQRRNA